MATSPGPFPIMRRYNGFMHFSAFLMLSARSNLTMMIQLGAKRFAIGSAHWPGDSVGRLQRNWQEYNAYRDIKIDLESTQIIKTSC